MSMLPSKPNRITLVDIARAAGTSPATVSLALRNDPRVAKATHAKVHKVANELGYRPDPHLSQLMGYLRGGRSQAIQSVIALLSDWSDEELRSNVYMSGLLRGIMERGEQLGYQFEIFNKTSRMSYRRIESILSARGIEAVIVLPHSAASFSIDTFDFSKFCAVCIGYGMTKPELHRIASQQTRAAMLVTEKVLQQGYQRVGLVLERVNDMRTHHRYMSGFLGQLVTSGFPMEIPVLMTEGEPLPMIKQWLRDYSPDAVIGASLPLVNIFNDIGLKPGKHIGLAMINYIGSENLPRIETPYHTLGLASVNMVHGFLCSHERGIPEIPQVLTVPGKWFDGKTLPPRDTLKPWPKV